MVLQYAGRVFDWAASVPLPFVQPERNPSLDDDGMEATELKSTVDVSGPLEQSYSSAVEVKVVTQNAMMFAHEIALRNASGIHGKPIEMTLELEGIPKNDHGFQLQSHFIIDRLQEQVNLFCKKMCPEYEYTIVAVATHKNERKVAIHINPPEVLLDSDGK